MIPKGEEAKRKRAKRAKKKEKRIIVRVSRKS